MRKFGFDNECGTSYAQGLRFLDFPQFDYGQEIVDLKEIPGRAGTLSVRSGRYTDTVITNSMEFVSESLEDFEEKKEQILKWIRKSKKVSYTDSEDRYFVVKKIDVSDIKRKHGFYGAVTVVFTCEPFAYLMSGDFEVPINASETLYNTGRFTEPIYIVSGMGTFRLTVNGKNMIGTVHGRITIDTQRMIAYKDDFTLQNSEVSGDYEDLRLMEGENLIKINDGFECSVIPRWRY